MATKKKYYKAYEDDKWNSAARKKKRFKGAQKRIENDKAYDESIIGKENKSKVGSFEVAAGGGTPKQDGGGRGSMNQDFYIAENVEEAEEIREDNPGAKVRVAQGRDPETGEFISNRDMGMKRKYEKRGKHSALIDRDKKDVEFKKGDVIIDKKGDRDVILKDVSYQDFVEDVQKYLARKKGRKSGLEKELKGGSLRYIGGNKRKGSFLSGDNPKAEYFEYKKKKGKKGKAIRRDLIKKKGTEAKPKKVNPNKLNVNLAKSNPVRFAAENKEKLDNLSSLAKSKGKKIKQSILISKIASDKYKTWKELEDLINNL